MGRKGKRVLEQAVGSSDRVHDYETIRIIPTQKQESTGTGSTTSQGISAPAGLDPPESKAVFTRSANTVLFLVAEVILYMYFTGASCMSIGNTLAQASFD